MLKFTLHNCIQQRAALMDFVAVQMVPTAVRSENGGVARAKTKA